MWTAQSGPLTGISAGGVATAGIVFQNTIGTVQGTFAGQTASLGLTVVNSLPDNFGTYAGDGIADDWQGQYFGVNNPAWVEIPDDSKAGRATPKGTKKAINRKRARIGSGEGTR